MPSKIVQHVLDKNFSEASKEFATEIHSRAADIVNNKKLDLGATLFDDSGE